MISHRTLLVFNGTFTYLVSGFPSDPPGYTSTSTSTDTASVRFLQPRIGRVTRLTSGVTTHKVDAYPLYAASSLAANALVRCSFAGKFDEVPFSSIPRLASVFLA